MNEEIEYHVGRILILLHAMAPGGGVMRGLTKLVKLDFLLRYPGFLDRLLTARKLAWPVGTEPTESERRAVESPMIRYKYGPWDDRYYPILGYLSGTQLAEVLKVNGVITIRLTERGRAAAKQLAEDPNWSRVRERAVLLRQHFDLSGNALKESIYRELPDAVDRAHRTTI